MECAPRLQRLHLGASDRFFRGRCMERCDKVHAAEKPLFERCHLIQTAQLVQQKDLRRECPQCHLHSLSLRDAGDHIQRFTGGLPPGAARKQLPPLVDHRDQFFLADKLPRHAAQKRRFAAYEKHPDEMRLHGCTQFLWERDSFLTCNAQVDGGQFLQNDALFRVLQKAPTKARPAPGGTRHIPLCDLRLMRVDRPTAQCEQDLLHLLRRQKHPLQGGKLPRCFLRCADCPAHRERWCTAHPQPKLLHIGRKGRRHVHKLPSQPARQRLNHLIILVHPAFSFRVSCHHCMQPGGR
jgi:hypothetical protein